MPQLTSPLSTPVGMPMFNGAHIGKLAGAWMHFPTFTAFQSAVLAEQNLVVTGDGLWADGQPITIASETASRAVRVWSVPLNHARTVRLGSVQLVLAGASNTVLATTGAPSNATGNNGDVAADWTNGRYYTKTAGAWVNSGAVGGTGGAGGIPIPYGNDGADLLLQPPSGGFVSIDTRAGGGGVNVLAGGRLFGQSGADGVELRAANNAGNLGGQIEMTPATLSNGGNVLLKPGSGSTRGLVIISGAGLPTTNPAVAGALWSDGGTVKVSAG